MQLPSTSRRSRMAALRRSRLRPCRPTQRAPDLYEFASVHVLGPSHENARRACSPFSHLMQSNITRALSALIPAVVTPCVRNVNALAQTSSRPPAKARPLGVMLMNRIGPSASTLFVANAEQSCHRRIRLTPFINGRNSPLSSAFR